MTMALPRIRENNAPIIGVWLFLLGGWMLNLPGGVFLGVGIAIVGLIAAEGPRMTRTTHVGLALAAVLAIGGVGDQRAVGFALLFGVVAIAASIPRHTVDRALDALEPLAIVSVCWAWGTLFFTDAPLGRALGPLGLNPNATAGFAVFMAAWLMLRKPHLLTLAVLASVVVATGSRWGAVCMIAVPAALVLLRLVNWRAPVVMASTIVVVLLAQLVITDHAPLLRPVAIAPGATTGTSAVERLSPDITPSVLPAGYRGVDDGKGAHNLFTRAAVELGYIGLAVFVGLIVYAFWRAPLRYRVMLGVLVMLGMFDFYVWGPFQLAPLLWMVLGTGETQTE